MGLKKLWSIAYPQFYKPNSIATIISLKSKFDTVDIQKGIVLSIVLVYIVVRSSTWIKEKIGPGGAAVLRKLFGILLLAIAVKLFRENARI